MFRRFSINFAIFSMGIDIFLVLLSMVVASNLGGTNFLFRVFPGNFDPALYFLFPLIWWGLYLFGAVYDGHRNLRVLDELTSFAGLSLAAIVVSAGVLYLSYRETARSLFAAFVVLTLVFQLSWRLAARAYWRTVRANGNGHASHRILIIGAGTVGKLVKAQVEKVLSENGVEVAGFLDDDPDKQTDPGVIGKISAYQDVIEKYGIEEVIIALPSRVHAFREKLIEELGVLPVKVWAVPDVFRLALYRSSVEQFAGMPMVDLRAPTLTDYQRYVKRGFDLAVAATAFILTLPLMLLIAIAVRFDSRGPVIFRQKRIGENGQLFTMYKFRTMVDNAETLQQLLLRKDEQGNLIHKTREDPRVTKVGKFLRRASLDELPQLYNVLRGDMSIIGPRPELPALVDKYEAWQRVRLTVPPGLTGWWQVNGRSDRPMHLHTEDDIYYVKNYSLWLDLFILLKTIVVLVRREGAY